jgi:AGCS family alanine or glycine:cation symporter
MKKYLLSMLTLILPLATFAQEAEKGLDEKINDWFMPIADAWEGLVLFTVPIAGFNIPFVVILLVTGATFFTVYFKFPSFTKFGLAINTVRGKYDEIEGGHHAGKTDMAIDGDISS